MKEKREITFTSSTGATKIEVHGIIIFNGRNHGSHKFQEYEQVPKTMHEIDSKQSKRQVSRYKTIKLCGMACIALIDTGIKIFNISNISSVLG